MVLSVNDRPIVLLKSALLCRYRKGRPSHPVPRSRNVCKAESHSAASARSPVAKQNYRDRTTRLAIAEILLAKFSLCTNTIGLRFGAISGVA
ncbi:hypothetical protein [Phormidesmis priestleyi]